MDLETRLLEREQYGEREGRKEGRKEGLEKGRREAAKANLQKSIQGYRKFGVPEDAILEQVLADYSQYFTPEEIRAYMKK
ncbi:hypothetical protein EJK17_05230 [Lactobacillus xujianguonis]|uniref:Uncharacterized protein n=1 Tax=Lactobacillus xujianguonis TaxID=2495899 RepID=A0A437SV33_9LACO|nr:hypothetical protein [Lactobacillus xujianguonis]RVU70801.1 hypothetical protein EJK17_05230 [Lactobacillus xujianguonis]RVU77007.1 hypothetical protein EJK20_02540 [Lactobacillus xujianguonis]